MIERMQSYWRVIKGKKRPLRFIISRTLMELGLSKFLTIYRDGYKIRFFPTALSETLWTDRDERLGDEYFFRKYLRAGDRVVDVGSNIGTLTLTAACIVGEKGKVVSIEPHPRTFTFLLRNIHLNPFKNILALNIAVGDKGGYANLSSSKSDDINRVLKNSEGLKVPISRLDEVINNEWRIALLKIDVEGYEKFVICGTEKILRNIDCIYFESWEERFEEFGYSTTDLISLMQRNGFEVYNISNNKLERLSNHYKSLVCENLIAIRNMDDFIKRTSFEFKE
jgi:FkbM family methyltransferase